MLLKREVIAMYVFEALTLMIAFATLIYLITKDKTTKK